MYQFDSEKNSKYSSGKNSSHRKICRTSPSSRHDSLLLIRLATLILRRQPRLRGADNLHSVLTEATTMDRTVPTFLDIVPTYHTLQMRAECREFVNTATLVLVYGDGFAGLGVQDAATADGEFFNVFDVALEESLVLRIDLQVVGDHAGNGGEGW